MLPARLRRAGLLLHQLGHVRMLASKSSGAKFVHEGDDFSRRHIGPSAAEQKEMLKTLGFQVD
jgi:hypothetical protein